MANGLFAKGKQHLLAGDFNLSSDTIKVGLFDGADFTFNASTMDAYDDISAGVIGTPQTLGSKTITDGVFDAGDVTFTAVSGDQFEYVIIYLDSGSPSTSYLLFYADTATGLPLTPSGTDLILTFNASGIFAL